MARKKSAEQRSEAPKPKPRQRKPAGGRKPSAPEPGRNGTTSAEPAPPPPPRPDGTAATAPEPAAYRPGNSRAGHGQLLREMRADEPTWFLRPLIPGSALTLVVGVPSSGKSTLGSWLCSEATRPAILPGFEESIPQSLVPRLLHHGVDPDGCLVLHDRAWAMPMDRTTLTEVLREHHCDLLWVDPIDSYVSVQSENDPDGVTESLEAFARLAREVGCAVVAARHPGKHQDNICPGSRKWRAVPREVIELRYEEGPPERRWLRCRKDPYHQAPDARAYRLAGPVGSIRTFELAESVPLSQVQTWSVSDTADVWKIDEAVEMLRLLLAEGEQEAAWIYAQAAREGISDRIVRYAARRLGVCPRRQGAGKEHRSVYPQLSLTPEP